MKRSQDIILFDGVCNLCNGAIIFIIKRDPKNRFKFAALQSDIGKELLGKHKIDVSKTDSIVLIRDHRAFVKASATLRIAQKMSGAWPLLYLFTILPKLINNTFYDFIARNRYKWFGQKESCMIPTPELKARFLHN